MDNAFQELDYSDISAKHVTGSQNKKFSEIDTKRRGGILKLLVSFILFLLLIIFIIVTISKSIKVNSLNKDINKAKKELGTKEIEINDGEYELNKIEKYIEDKKKEINNGLEELDNIKKEIIEIEKKNSDLNNDINNLKGQIETAKSNLKEYEGIQESELIEQLEHLKDEIDLLRQTPME